MKSRVKNKTYFPLAEWLSPQLWIRVPLIKTALPRLCVFDSVRLVEDLMFLSLVSVSVSLVVSGECFTSIITLTLTSCLAVLSVLRSKKMLSHHTTHCTNFIAYIKSMVPRWEFHCTAFSMSVHVFHLFFKYCFTCFSFCPSLI